VFDLSLWDIFGPALIAGSLLAVVGMLSAGPVILISQFVRLRARRGRASGGDPAFWCWHTVAAYAVVLWIARGLLASADLDPHGYPVPFFVYGLSLGLGLTLWDRRQRACRRRRDAS
jgi:hypothetical protein